MKSRIRKHLAGRSVLLLGLVTAGVALILTADAKEVPAFQRLSAGATVAAVGGGCHTDCLNICKDCPGSGYLCSSQNGACAGQQDGTKCGGCGGTKAVFTFVYTADNKEATLSTTADIMCTPSTLCACDGAGKCKTAAIDVQTGKDQCTSGSCGG